MRYPAAALLLTALQFGAAGCSAGAVSPPASGAVVVTLVPPVAASAGEPESAGTYPRGSRVVMLPADVDGSPDELSAGLVAAGGPDVAVDARSVLFAGQANVGDVWGIYETRLGERSPTPVWLGDTDCVEPAYLAHGAIVFSCVVPDGQGKRALYVLSPERSGPERITWGPTPASDPTPLADGRILFAMGGTDELAAGLATQLYTVNADGSLLEAFGDVHATAASRSRPRQARDGELLFLLARAGAPTRPFGSQMTRPGEIVPLDLPPAAGDDPSVHSAEPDGEGLLLVAADDSGARVVRLAPGGDAEIVFAGIDGLVPLEAVPLRPTLPPRGRPRIVADTGETGFLVGYDAGRSDGVVGPAHGSPEPRSVRFQIQRAGQILLLASGADVDAMAAASLHLDRSFFFEVPADVPLRATTLDATGEPIATSAWFWVRPGETRACFGCHEGHAAAPVNRPIDAIAAPPVPLQAALEALAAVSRASASGGGR